MVVGTPLQGWEDREVNLVFKVILSTFGLTLLESVCWLLALKIEDGSHIKVATSPDGTRTGKGTTTLICCLLHAAAQMERS